MCTAASYKTRDFYFGRTLDNDCSYGEEIVTAPRNFPFHFIHAGEMLQHYAITGMAHVSQGYPLYYDAINEKGLAIAGLNFVGNAWYGKCEPGKDNIAQFELIPWILGQCASVQEARARIGGMNITDDSFNKDFPPSQLHWMIADENECIVLEVMRDGMHVHDNPVGVLTNNPPFEMQLFNLNNYMHLSAKAPENRFAQELPLRSYSLGMGAMGLPGDLSSQSRFVRAALVKMNSASGGSEEESVGQFFHILDSVAMARGCNDLGGRYEITIYSSCCNVSRGIYYYTTYDNRSISGVDMHREKLDGNVLARHPLAAQEQIRMQN